LAASVAVDFGESFTNTMSFSRWKGMAERTTENDRRRVVLSVRMYLKIRIIANSLGLLHLQSSRYKLPTTSCHSGQHRYNRTQSK